MKTYNTPKHHGLMVMENGKKLDELDKKLKKLEKDFKIREVDITFKEEKLQFKQIRSSRDAYRFIHDVLYKDIEIQEHFIVLFMDQSNTIIGYYRHSKGTINSTSVDVQVIIAVAIKTLSKSMIISHNHPSGNKTPSEADRRMTKQLKQAAQIFGISVLDHIVATKNDYYSFADNGERSLSGLPGAKAKRGLSGPQKPGDELEYAALNYACK
ncbi:MAG TPA: DNA repair protein [Cryomorphaceae bacterium]|nr:DNA repair protein [Cryomorphaceae bacterium]